MLPEINTLTVTATRTIHNVDQAIGITKVLQEGIASTSTLIRTWNKASHILDPQRMHPPPTTGFAMLRLHRITKAKICSWARCSKSASSLVRINGCERSGVHGCL